MDDEFQKTLENDIKMVNNSSFMPSDKTANMYKPDKDHYNKLLRESITSAYKKADEKVYDTINEEAGRL